MISINTNARFESILKNVTLQRPACLILIPAHIWVPVIQIKDIKSKEVMTLMKLPFYLCLCSCVCLCICVCILYTHIYKHTLCIYKNVSKHIKIIKYRCWSTYMRSRRLGFTRSGWDEIKVVFDSHLPYGSYISVPGLGIILHSIINSKCTKCRDKPCSLVIRVLLYCLNPKPLGCRKVQPFCLIS